MNDDQKQVQIRQFAEFIYPDLKENERIEIRAFPVKKGNDVFRAWVKNIDQFVRIVKRQDTVRQSYNIFTGISYRGEQSAIKAKGTKEFCAGTSVLWVDLDYGTDGHKRPSKFATLEEALVAVKSLDEKPDMVVHTGGGLHLYWRLTERADFPGSLDRVELANKTLAKLCDGDAVHDVSHIMRVPGTRNWKYETETYAEIVDLEQITKG